MQNESQIKTAILISILIHALFIGLIKGKIIRDTHRARKIISIDYYKEEIPKKVPAKKTVKKSAKKPAKKITKKPETVKKVEEIRKKEPVKKVEIKPEKEELVIKKPIPKPIALKKETVKKTDARKENKESSEKKPIQKKGKIKDLKELVIDDEKAKEKKIKIVKKTDEKPEPAKDDGTIETIKKEEQEKKPSLLQEPMPKDEPDTGKTNDRSSKGDIEIAKIIPSINRLEELNRLESESTKGIGDKEIESVNLDSTNVKYVSYLDHIKLAIELAWNYPEAAARRGIEGEGVLSFTINSKGELADIKLISSTGSKILDDRFVRAVKMASPFPPLPENYKTKNLNIIATYRYILSIVYKIKK